MKFVKRLLSDIFHIAKRDRKWWLIPLVLILVGIGGFLAVATLAGPVAPFIYPLF